MLIPQLVKKNLSSSFENLIKYHLSKTPKTPNYRRMLLHVNAMQFSADQMSFSSRIRDFEMHNPQLVGEKMELGDLQVKTQYGRKSNNVRKKRRIRS